MDDLLPDAQQSTFTETIVRIVKEEFASLARAQPPSSGLRDDWNGSRVRLPGFVVPLELDGTGVTEFILVPYVGACVHVPPPPANQLVLVSAQDPHKTRGIFEAVTVTGVISTSPVSTDLAEIGYHLAADTITPVE